MSVLKTKIKTASSLGLMNLARVLYYRLSIKWAFNPACCQLKLKPMSPFFTKPQPVNVNGLVASNAWLSEALYFGKHVVSISDSPPDWHLNPLTEKRVQSQHKPWWKIADFDSGGGDIKVIWEASRFDWVLSFAQHAVLGNDKLLERLNHWLEDWLANNLPYQGINWKCGQEASIRVMHLAMAATILNQVKQPTESLMVLVELHLKRIAPTLSYAKAQDNNHGTSEAAALYIGGSWLTLNGNKKGLLWQNQGKKHLENRVRSLIGKEGSFSQYSLNYHRLVLDTLCMVEVWRKQLRLSGFSNLFQSRVSAATTWLYQFIDRINGDGPNFGANDGARLLPLTDCDTRDFRPTVQLAALLFLKKRVYSHNDNLDMPAKWLRQSKLMSIIELQKSSLFNDGGYAVLRLKEVLLMLRYPRFRFRPSQADALHLDFWVGPQNELSDAGTYSYNTDKKWLNYFPSTKAHNTIEFDERSQMPRLSRFLFGHWLKTKEIESIHELENGAITFWASYCDYMGAEHKRSIELSSENLLVTDSICGFEKKAVLRWRLMSGQWHIEGNRVTDGKRQLVIHSTMDIKRLEIVTGWKSRYYLHKEEVPVLEVEVHSGGELITEYHWAL